MEHHQPIKPEITKCFQGARACLSAKWQDLEIRCTNTMISQQPTRTFSSHVAPGYSLE